MATAAPTGPGVGPSDQKTAGGCLRTGATAPPPVRLRRTWPGWAILIGCVVFTVWLCLPPPPSTPAPPPPRSRPAGMSLLEWDYSVGKMTQAGMTKEEAERATRAVWDAEKGQAGR